MSHKHPINYYTCCHHRIVPGDQYHKCERAFSAGPYSSLHHTLLFYTGRKVYDLLPVRPIGMQRSMCWNLYIKPA